MADGVAGAAGWPCRLLARQSKAVTFAAERASGVSLRRAFAIGVVATGVVGAGASGPLAMPVLKVPTRTGRRCGCWAGYAEMVS